MKQTPLRSRLASVAFVILVAAAWLYLAPTQIGGATTYLTTSGISMEPRFHSGDLALVRPADRYSVGEIVAYHSTLLHTIVLHRIIGRDGDRYVFKGDNNNFVDPTHPVRSQLVGALWLRIPQGGRVLGWLHSPPVVAVLVVAIFLLLFGADEERRRRDRRRRGGRGSVREGARSMSGRDSGVPSDNRGLLTAVAAVVVFFVLGLYAFTRPARDPATTKIAYSQGVSFGYSASAPAGPVYPDGSVTTGDPIFLNLVHEIRVQVDYRLTTVVAHTLAGTEDVLVRLTGPGGWTRSTQITPAVHFTGDQATAAVTLSLPYIQSLFAQVARLTGAPAEAGYSVAVVPQIRIGGTLAGQPLNTSLNPVLSLQLAGVQLLPGVGSSSSGNPPSDLDYSQSGTIPRAATTASTISVLGRTLKISTLRWLSLFGFLVAGASALLMLQLKRREPFAETARIQSRYGHLIVSIVGAPTLTGRSVFDVASIKALVALAERSERLILHQYGDSADTFLVDDEGTVYRYRTRPTGVVWSDSPAIVAPAVRPVDRPPARQNGAGGAAAGRDAVSVVATGDGNRPAPDPPADLAAYADSSRRAPAATKTAGLRRPVPPSPVVQVRLDDPPRAQPAAAAVGAVHPVVPIAPVLRVPVDGPSSSARAAREGAWPRPAPAVSVESASVGDRSPGRPADTPDAGAWPRPAPAVSVDSASVGDPSPGRPADTPMRGRGLVRRLPCRWTLRRLAIRRPSARLTLRMRGRDPRPWRRPILAPPPIRRACGPPLPQARHDGTTCRWGCDPDFSPDADCGGRSTESSERTGDERAAAVVGRIRGPRSWPRGEGDLQQTRLLHVMRAGRRRRRRPACMALSWPRAAGSDWPSGPSGPSGRRLPPGTGRRARPARRSPRRR